MVKYSSYTNQLRFSLLCHQNKILPNDLQLEIESKRNEVKQLTLKEFHLAENFHQNSYVKTFDLTKKRRTEI